jgi:nitrite reductase/ring-hydroxylating ferredoxin subunit
LAQQEAGTGRCPDAPAVQDILRRDGMPAAPPFLGESFRFQGDADIPYARYLSPDFARLEMERLWPRTWQWACRVEQIPEPGDFAVYDVGPHSLVIVRGGDGVIRAFFNSCLHRGTKLKPSASCGSAETLRCPFHGWTWTLEGRLDRVRCPWDFPQVDPDAFGLPQAQVAEWGGFVFINMDPAAPPLADQLGILPAHFRDWPLDDRYIAVHVEKVLPCNWKLALEAFIENYHTAETHPQLLAAGGDENTQYDTFGATVGRFIAPKGVPSPSLQRHVSEEEMLGSMVRDPSVLGGGRIAIPPGGTARTVMADHLRRTLGTAYGLDLSGRSTSEMIDTIEYNLFPNMVLFLGITLPLAYRFRPLASPDRCLFDLMFLKPVPAGQPRPAPAEPVRVGIDESYGIVPGIDAAVARIYDQDTGNLRAQQEGMAAGRKPGQTLAVYAESRIRQLHATLDTYLNPQEETS